MSGGSSLRVGEHWHRSEPHIHAPRNDATAQLTSTFGVTTSAKEGAQTGTVMALLRHQWLNATTPFTSYTYPDVRGTMKVVTGTNFQTLMAFNGILPVMPNVGYNKATLEGFIKNESTTIDYTNMDTAGKDIGKIAKLIPLAQYIGDTTSRDKFINTVKTSIQNWLTASGNQKMYYSKTWNRLIGYPSNGDSFKFSDHHFNYGYFIRAAAEIAQRDPTWASQSQFGGMVEMLIRDVNTWNDNDPLFAKWSYYDPFEGHGWANGHGFSAGNDEEAEAEAMNDTAGVIMWGINTGNKTIRDQGIFMYLQEAAAMEQYWWDVDGTVFPTNWGHTCVGQVWGNGGLYTVWFDPKNPRSIDDINYPFRGNMMQLFVGRHPDYVKKNFNEAFTLGDGTQKDRLYEYLAFGDPAAAWQGYLKGIDISLGGTKSYAYQDLASINQAGLVVTNVTANLPTYGVFKNGNVVTYSAYNPHSSPRLVTFSDGFSMQVPARTQITQQR
jgi:endoglucanase Acf2